jgi:hypothetical protein
MTTNMNAHPRVINNTSHHASGRPAATGEERPVIEGRVPEPVPDGTWTRSDRQTPKLGTTLEEFVHVAETQLPLRKTSFGLEHARQELGPLPEQLEQLGSQDWQVDEVTSKYCDWLQVGKQRPLVKTGRFELQVEHWLKDGPEQLLQSG